MVVNDWRELIAVPQAQLAGKRVACRLKGLPVEAYRDVAFRDLPGKVSLWVVESQPALKQAQNLSLNACMEASLSSCLETAQPVASGVTRGALRTPEEKAAIGIIRQSLGALGLGPKKHEGLAVSIFREFVKPPYGGGNQFMLALKENFEAKGVKVLVNEISPYIDGYFFDSLWFDPRQYACLERIRKPVVVHRIDGPIHLYRGKDREIDDKIFEVNARFATSTVIQSNFTLLKTYESGYRPVRPVVINNSVSPAIFHPKPMQPLPRDRKIRVIATSWSDNANKGGPVYKWLEDNLDTSRYEFTFVGRCSETLTKAKVIAPVPSEKLAGLLREHDIYVTASKNDPCSNALVEALACGLPAVALNSGGHPELVGEGGLCFDTAEEIPSCLERISGDYMNFCARIRTNSMDFVADSYLELVRNP